MTRNVLSAIATRPAYPSIDVSVMAPSQRVVLAPWQERKAKALLERSLGNRLFIADVAKQCAMSRSHFSRVFKKTTGLSPKEWYLQLKIKQAKVLLVAGLVPLSQISLECGFADQSHFSRMFSKLVGATPKRWQRSNLLANLSV